VALLEAIIVLVAIALLTGVIAGQVLANRRALDRRQYQQQSLWLARGGIELAVGRLLADPAGYTGETVQPLPRAQVKITVARQQDHFRIISTARYPDEGREAAARSLTRTFRRVMDSDRVRLEPAAKE
jgi:type II secretory pathway component PulK